VWIAAVAVNALIIFYRCGKELLNSVQMLSKEKYRTRPLHGITTYSAHRFVNCTAAHLRGHGFTAIVELLPAAGEENVQKQAAAFDLARNGLNTQTIYCVHKNMLRACIRVVGIKIHLSMSISAICITDGKFFVFCVTYYVIVDRANLRLKSRQMYKVKHRIFITLRKSLFA